MLKQYLGISKIILRFYSNTKQDLKNNDGIMLKRDEQHKWRNGIFSHGMLLINFFKTTDTEVVMLSNYLSAYAT